MIKKKIVSLKIIRNFLIFLSIILISFGMGFRLGEKNKSEKMVFNDKEKSSTLVSRNIDLGLFWDVWNRLNRYYIEKDALDSQKMIYGAIKGMVESVGDPYTVFLPPSQNKDAKDDLGGKFEGIGVQLGIKDKKIVVVAPLKGTPADKAGLKSGDIILKVDNEDAMNWTLPQAVSKIRGPKGTIVTLNIFKIESSSSAEIKVARDTIKVASVEWEILNLNCKINNGKCEIIKERCDKCQKIAYLKLSRFGDQTNEEWNKAVTEIVSEIKKSNGKISSLIFDLRNNPGGYLTGSVFITSEFLKEGTVVVQDSVTSGKTAYTVNRKGNLPDIPLVVLINKGTASASEIVAGALKEKGRAKLVGETTFGKGSVQEAQDLPGGSGIHITTAKWLLPSGKWINSVGVEPDIKVENNDTKPDEDLQLLKAVEVIENGL